MAVVSSSKSEVLAFAELVQPEVWIDPASRKACTVCNRKFYLFKRRNQCFKCGDIMCRKCSIKRLAQTPTNLMVTVDVCVPCNLSPSITESELRPVESSKFSATTSVSSINDGNVWDTSSLSAPWIPMYTLRDICVVSENDDHSVWRVRYGSKRTLVAKRLAPGNLTTQTSKSFVASINLMARLQHPRIVSLVGVSWTRDTDLQVLHENMLNGNLRSYLDAGGTGVSKFDHNARKIRIALDIAEALVYLHQQSPPVVHGALQSRKVLLDENYRAKLTGITTTSDTIMHHDERARRWLAPEVLTGSAPTHHPSRDLYSFGVILTELDADAVPYSDCCRSDGLPLSNAVIELRVNYGDLKPTLQRSCPREIRQIVSECLAFHPEDRPTALEVLVRLRTFLRTYGLETPTTASTAPESSAPLCDLQLRPSAFSLG